MGCQRQARRDAWPLGVMLSSGKIRRKSYALRMLPPLARMRHKTSLISWRALHGKAKNHAIDEYWIIMRRRSCTAISGRCRAGEWRGLVNTRRAAADRRQREPSAKGIGTSRSY